MLAPAPEHEPETAHSEADSSDLSRDSFPAERRRARFLEDGAEIARVLKTLRDQRAAIQLHFKDQSTPCTARILDVLHSTFLLEDVLPRSGLQPLYEGTPFALHARAPGLYLHCDGNRVLHADSERGIPYFHVAVPRCVLLQQRRKSERFRLPLRVATNNATVTLFRSHDVEPLVGRVIDISAGGCRAEFNQRSMPAVVNDEQVESCAISIPNLLELNATAAIRHHRFDKRSQTLTCGIELIEMHVTDRRRLEQFIQSLAKVSQPS